MDGVTESNPAHAHGADADRRGRLAPAVAPAIGAPALGAAVSAGAAAAALHAIGVSASGADWSAATALASGAALFATMTGLVLWTDHRARAAHARETAVLEQLVSDARLETLRTQLDPHFVFNALNAIAAHLDQNPRGARWMLDQLGSLLRMSLEQAREQQTPLAREMAFISCYLHLQKARFDDRLDVETLVAPDVQQALVPSLVLQPLVENAIRHGVAKQPAARIEIRAWREGDHLRLRVHDDGPGLPADWDPAHGFGVGLSITRERLRRLYGAAHTFAIEGGPGAGVQVSLTLPFRTAEDEAPGGAEDQDTRAAAAARTRTADDSRGS